MMMTPWISNPSLRWWIRQLKGEEFESVYLTDQYNSFSSAKDVQGLPSNTRLAEAQKRAQTFVDRCEQAEKQNNQQEKEALQRLQWEEMKTVFNFTKK